MQLKRFYEHLVSFALTTALSLSVVTGVTAGQVYKWTDDQGNTHYSDKKPVDVDAQKMRVHGGKQSSERKDVKEQGKAIDEAKQKALEKKAKDLQAKSQDAERQSQCEALRDNIRKIEENSRIRIQENGEYRYLTPEEINGRKEKYQKQIDEFC